MTFQGVVMCIDDAAGSPNVENLYLSGGVSVPAAVRKPRPTREEAQAKRDARAVAKAKRAMLKADAQRKRAREAQAKAALDPVLARRDEVRKQVGAAAAERSKFEWVKDATTRAELLARWAHKNEGTPETHGNAAKLRQSPLSRMVKLGKVSIDDFASAVEIAEIVEMIESSAGWKLFGYQDRVDNAGSGRDALVEGLKRVRLEVAYTAWRKVIPTPKRMIIDMICTDHVTYVALARRHGLHWRTARKRLIKALRLWPDMRDLAFKLVDREDLDAAHARLEGGR